MRTAYASAVLVAMLVSGCQTGYQSKGFTGGFEELRLSADTYRINVEGNGYTSRDRAEQIALLRAAELTLQNGYSRFAVVGGAGVSEQVAGFNPIQTNRVGNTLITTGGGAITKPEGSIVIRMLKPADPAYASGLDAKLIDGQLRPKLVQS